MEMCHSVPLRKSRRQQKGSAFFRGERTPCECVSYWEATRHLIRMLGAPLRSQWTNSLCTRHRGTCGRPETLCLLLSRSRCMSCSCPLQSVSRGLSTWLDIWRPNAGGLGRNRVNLEDKMRQSTSVVWIDVDEHSDVFRCCKRARTRW